MEKVAIVDHSMRYSEVNKLFLKRRSLMKRLFNRFINMLTIALLLGAIPVAAIERPFALSGRGVATITPGEGGVLLGTVTGSGTATHLGSWTTVGSLTFTPDNGLLRSHGYATITAANGDKLEMEVQGALDPATGTDQGIFTFIGGTGRFADVSGSADFVVSLDPVTGGFELTMVGRINY
jgi:hypothetical protein